MRRRPTALVVSVMTVAIALAGCGRSDGGSSPATTVPVTLTQEAKDARFPADQVVWQVEIAGGPVSQVAWAARRPVLTVYGDGRVVAVQPAKDPRYDQPLPLRTASVGRSDLAAFVGRADASDLFGGDDAVDFGRPSTPDLTTTTVTVRGLGGEKTVAVYALGGRYDADVSETQAARREQLRQFLAAGDALLVDGGTPMAPDRIRVLVLPDDASYELSPDAHAHEDEAPVWPGEPVGRYRLPAPASLGKATISGCGEVTGSAASKIFTAALANPTPHWTVAGQRRTVLAVELLPGEAACG